MKRFCLKTFPLGSLYRPAQRAALQRGAAPIAVFLGLSAAAFSQPLAQWGPGIGARGGIPRFGTTDGSTQFSVYSHIDGIYDSSGLTNATGPANDFNTSSARGLELGFGGFGYRRWDRTTLGVDFHSTYPHYWPQRPGDGWNHMATLGFTHDFTPRWQLALGESGGTFTQRYLFYSPYNALGAAPIVEPTNEFFDNRTTFFSSVAVLTYQNTERLSFSAGGGGFLVRRDNPALVGLNSYQGSAGMLYKLSPTRKIGLDYSFGQFAYTGITGNAGIHNVVADYQQHIGRWWELAVRAGGYRAERRALRRVQLAPSVASLVGQNVILQPIEAVNYFPAADARLTRQFHRASMALGYSHSIDPGNGVYLASKRDTFDAGFTYSSLRRWNIGFNGGYGVYKSLTDNLGHYHSYRAGAGFTYKLFSYVHLIGRFDSDAYQIAATQFARDRYRVTFGLAFASPEFPLKLW
jgi:hypothetical protein